jgi:pimeloyl-ACP methyl ester carboxylesterase
MKISVCVATLSFALGLAVTASVANAANNNGALVLNSKATFTSGALSSYGTQIRRMLHFPAMEPLQDTSRSVKRTCNTRSQHRKYKYPIVLMHGGGHTANIFMTTPDGREGWFTSFTRRGFAVYAVDGPNRGRAGWDPTARIRATTLLDPPTLMEGVNIYTEEGAWTGFRWGPTFGTFYANTQFPKAYVEDYIRQIQPAYRNLPLPAVQVQNNLMRDDLRALVARIGPCILLGWSTGSLNVMQAASDASTAPNVKGLIGIEGFTATLP